MRHQKSGRKLGRTSAHRKAMYRNMVTSLLREGRIRTTTAKAKELRRIAERLVTLAKKVPASQVESAQGDEQQRLAAARVHNIRVARRWVADRDVLKHLFDTYGPLFASRAGGYTRIVKTGFRAGDNAPMSMIEFVERPQAEEPAADGDADADTSVDEAAADVDDAGDEA